MKMPPRPDPKGFGLKAALAGTDGALMARESRVPFAALATGNPLSVNPASLHGANILIRTASQLNAALALVALDGIAARLVIAPPDLKDEHLADVIMSAEVDTLVSEDGAIAGLRAVTVSPDVKHFAAVEPPHVTEWVMFTSGTSGPPKMVAHTLAGLTGAIAPAASVEKIVWGTFYDIRRYGGLQILLRALIGGASLVLSDTGETPADFLIRLGLAGVTHLTGTPSHWRRALMSPAIARIGPRYVRLSGEIADKAILDSLKVQFPNAAIAHAYASTEAGVGFEVTDGLEGFPAEFIGRPGAVEMKVENGTLHLRSPRTAKGYVSGTDALKCDGWVDSGDMVELRRSVCTSKSGQSEDRYYFTGRRGGIINVGGLKINPEEVEAVINRHPGVVLSRVSSRKNPITGALVVADVVLADAANDDGTFKESLLAACRAQLPAFKVPALVRFVERLELTAGGKLARHG
jgi:acyl-CoA synthetase (AMP-forming)/AMP-acid ligase II